MNEITTQKLFGHQKQEELFFQLLNQNSLPHCFLFYGPKGVGKYTFSLLAARVLAEKVPSFKDINFESLTQKQFTQQVIPSLHIINGEGNYKVEELTPAFTFLQTKVADDAWKVLIINNAHQLNFFGQNALLKQLEEPAPRTVIFLVTDQLNALLPTILSRAMRVGFNAISEGDFKAFCTHNNIYVDPDERHFYAAFTANCPGLMKEVFLQKTYQTYKEVRQLLESYLLGGDSALHKKFASSEQNEKQLFINLLYYLLHQHARGEVALPITVNALDLWHTFAQKHNDYVTQTLDIDQLFTTLLINLKQG